MRYRLITITPHLILELLKSGQWSGIKLVSEVPEDLTYVRAYINDVDGWGRIGVVVESSVFEELKEGDLIPHWDLIFESK